MCIRGRTSASEEDRLEESPKRAPARVKVTELSSHHLTAHGNSQKSPKDKGMTNTVGPGSAAGSARVEKDRVSRKPLYNLKFY